MTEEGRPKDEHEGAGNGDIGSLGEEAARLFAAATDWARQHTGDAAAAADSAATGPADWLGHEHIATGAPECRWCPVCQAISLLRTTSPDLKEHVGSLVVVARQILDSVAETVGQPEPEAKPRPEPKPKPDVERIDLTEDDPWD
jgi:hypothetical protein